MHKAVKNMMETFMREGCSTNAIADQITSFQDFNRFVGLEESMETERKFRQPIDPRPTARGVILGAEFHHHASNNRRDK